MNLQHQHEVLLKAKRELRIRKYGAVLLPLLGIYSFISTRITKEDVIVVFILYVVISFRSFTIDDLIEVVEANVNHSPQCNL